MTQDLEQTGLDAVDRFIDTWNSRDPERWAASLNYPHVRPSPFGPILVAQDAIEYASRVDFDQVVATGWDHSEWDYRQVIHTSPEKIHVAGQWSRYDAEGEVIHTNPILYIVTRVDGSWGIQSRFGSDYADDDHDTSGLEGRTFSLIDDFTSHLNNNNVEACAELLNYPHYGIGIGQLQEYLGPAQFTGTEHKITVTSLQVLQAGKMSVNAGLDLVVRDDSSTNEFQAVVNVTVRDDHLGIQAWSVLDPNAE
jgi:hypothetical protein|tara:strand:- start:949 stop:1704 length:756 start_codon:yes stop_codon:yes gene_type:complete